MARGFGGIDELSQHLDESKVLFGVLRFVFGRGTFARTKYVAVRFSGQQCPTVKRGRANAQKVAAMEALGGASCELSFETPLECNLDAVLEVLQRTVVVDDHAPGASMSKFSIQSMKADIEEQLQSARRQVEAAQLAAAAAAELTAAAAAAAAAAASASSTQPASGGSRGGTPPAGMTLNDLGRTLTLREALGMVRSDVAPLNWVMVTADPSFPEVVNAGSGSVPEMVRFLDDSQVFFGVLRMAFGRGPFRRCKWVFVHWSGERVGAVKRGKANAADRPLRKVFGPTNMDFFAATREDISVEILIQKVKKFVVTDGESSDDVDNLYSLDSFMEALLEEKKAAEVEFGGKDETGNATADLEPNPPPFTLHPNSQNLHSTY